MTGPRITTPRRTDSREPAARRKRRIPLPRRRRPRGSFPWRLISLGIVLMIVGAGIMLFTNPMFYVTRAEIGGVRYVPAEEIFTKSGIAGYHILWIDPVGVARRVTESPNIDSAEVAVRWPARVIILVRERDPAIVWEQGGARYWVDSRGHLMLQRQDLPSLVRVVNEGEAIPFLCPGPACKEQDAVSIDTQLVLGTQYLKTLRNNIDVLYYEPSRGLGYEDGRGWRAYFGIGTDMDYKLAVYEQLVDDLVARGIRPVYIDVANPEAPYYRVAQ